MADITITEGDTLEVDYSLENTGDGSGTFDPRLLVQGVQEDQDTGITLDPAQTATGTLQWPTESGDAVTDALAEAVTDDTSDSITVTVESAIPDSVVYDFESGDTSRWDDINDLTAVTTREYSGSYAGFCNSAQSNTYQARVLVDGYDGGAQPSEFEFFWQETYNSYGGGVRLFNSNGNVEIGLASNNPEWDIEDNNGFSEVSSGGDYDQWVRFTVMFDWQNGTFDVDFEALQTGQTYTDSGRPLKHGTDIRAIQLEDYGSFDWQVGGQIVMWFDNIAFRA